MQKRGLPFGDIWTLAKGADPSVPSIIRIRENLNLAVLELTLPHLLRVSWEMRRETENGLPSEFESKELERFENELVQRVEAEGKTVLAAVLSESCQRHWYFYLNDVNSFSESLHEVRQEDDRYPIELTVHRKEGWSLFRELIASCKGMIRPAGFEPLD